MELLLLLRFAEKLLALMGGLLCIYLGYRLFTKGVSGEASLKVTHDKSNVQILNAAPGMFFAFFGMTVLGLSVWRQTDLLVAEPMKTAAQTEISKPLPPLPQVEQELESLRHMFKDDLLTRDLKPVDSRTVIEGLKEGKYRIVHIASHGYFLEEQKPELLDTKK